MLFDAGEYNDYSVYQHRRSEKYHVMTCGQKGHKSELDYKGVLCSKCFRINKKVR